MKIIVTLVVLLALVGSAMAWDISDQLTYTEVKSGYQQARIWFCSAPGHWNHQWRIRQGAQ